MAQNQEQLEHLYWAVTELEQVGALHESVTYDIGLYGLIGLVLVQASEPVTYYR